MKTLNKIYRLILLFALSSQLSMASVTPSNDVVAYAPLNDDFANAHELASIDNFCSAPGVFTTTGATPDEALPSNWTAGPHTNVWYKFTATTTEVSIRIEVGSMNFPRLALHDAAKSEIKSVANAGSSNAIGMSVNTLTVGGTYYINVSNGPNGGHSGTFVLCVDDAVSQDYPAGAVTLTHSNDNCSTLAGYNTRIGTPDGTKPSNWANGPNANVWFRFQATTSEVALNLNVSGSEGNMKFPRLALHDNTMQVLANVGDDGNSIDIGLSHTGLTIGDWYYVSVDNGPNAGHRGSFTLCIDTEASYDYPSGAIELTNTDNYCSGLAEFTTQIATPDGSRPSAWTNGPNANVWFTFIAGSADVTIDVKTGSSEGNVLYPKVALHDASLAELASVKDAGKSVDVSLIYSALTLGQRYYINIDNGVNQGHRGTFSLCVDNPGSAPSVPAIPTNLAAVAAGPDQINLSWDDVATETTYTIWRSTTSGAGFTALASNIAANTTTYNDLDLPANTQYFYYLEAVNGSGSSAPTAEVSATTDPVPVPPVPTNLAAVTEGTDQINLSWDDVSAETSYRLWRSTQSGIGFSVLAGNIAANTTTYSDQNLAPNTQYFYYLEAVNSSGSSAPTAEVNATTDQVPDPGSGTQRTFLIDLGNPTNGTTDNWNNITGPQRAGMTISGLVDATGLSSSLNFEVVSDASNGYGNGFNNTGYAGETLGYPTSANSDSYFSHGAGGTYKLTGLDNSKTYTITIFGSRTATSGGRVGTYTIDGVTQTLDGQNNTSNTISFTDLQPDVNNEITLDFGVAAGSTFGYLNVLEVVEKVATQTLYAVEWTNVTGADISAENLITNSQSTPGWNAGASSLNVLPVDQDGYIEFTATENNKNKIIGLSNIDLGTETNGIRYAFLLQQSGAVNVFESGLNKGNLGSYAPTDVFRITKNGQTIEYYINDMLVHTSTAPVELPLVVDLSLYSPGSSSPAINTTFDSSIPTPTFNSNVTWNNVIGAATDVNNTLSKTTGTSTQWDAGASSLNVLGAGADGWMEFMTDAGNQSRMIGLTYADIDTDFRTIRYALYLQSSGNLNVYESGINKGSFGTYGAGDIFRIERNAGTITYLKNGIVFYTSTLSSASTLMVDASLYTSASKVLGASTSFDTSITTPEVTSNVTWTNLVDVTVEADNVLLRSMGSGWNVGASTANVLLDAQDGWVSFYANKANDNKMIGMTDSDVDANFNTILYAVQLQNNATYSVYESGVHRGNFGAYGTGDEFRIERVGGTINYLHNGTTFYTSTVQNTGSLIVDTSLGSPGASFAGVNTSFGVLDQGTVPDHLEIAALKDLFELTGGSSWTSQTDADPGNDWAEGTEWDAINYIDQLAGWFGITLSNGDVIEIALGSNGLSGGTPSSIASLIGLTHLDFSYNDLTGPLLDELGDLSNLKVLILTGNQFTGSIPTTFSSLTQLERLSLDRNDLTGNIPIGFDSLQELQRLDIQQNRLSGGFSTLFSNLSELTRLDIGFNEFSGPIPTAIGNLSKLETLIMAGNGFDGSLPSSLGNLTSLTYLHLGNNDLSGEVPESLGNLTMLSSLNLSNNNFTGAIPASLVNLDNLSTLTLNFNALSELPPGMADMASLNSINVGSNALGFEDLEQFYSGPNTPKVSVTHSNQAFVTSAYAIGAVIGQALEIPIEGGGAYSRYQWEFNDNGTWIPVPSPNENPEGTAYQLSLFGPEHAGQYRYIITNDWVTSLTFISSPIIVQLSAPAPVVTASAINSEVIELTWASSVGTSYEIEMSFDGVSDFIQIADTEGSPYQNGDLEPGTTYYYRIRAVFDGVNSAYSEVVSATTTLPLPTVHDLSQTPQYNGNISAIKWGSATSATERLYTYKYDKMNRIKAAEYGESLLPNIWTQQKGGFQVYGIQYDLNGNIENLNRQELNNSVTKVIDQLTYTYAGNQLQYVEDAAGWSGFKNGHTGDATNTDYQYDGNGNMSADLNKDIANITYNYLNLPERVTKTDGSYMIYGYDAAGTKLFQEVYDETDELVKRTDYVGGYVYETEGPSAEAELQFIQHEEGRIVPEASSWTYQYHLKDHLGNTRLTFTTAPKTVEFLATMESENAMEEEQLFSNLAETRVTFVGASNSPNEVVRLNATQPVGPAISLRVERGDVVDLQSYIYYEGGSGYSNPISNTSLIAAIASAFGGVNGGTDVQQMIFNDLNAALTGAAGAFSGTNDDEVPAAYLNYLLFDEDMMLADAGFKKATSAADFNTELLQFDPIAIEKSGYIYVYLSNESQTNNWVYFDDLQVTLSESAVVQADDYYPFGLTHDGGFQRVTGLKNDYKYNGKERINDLDLAWDDFGARMYMSEIGRWGAIDPLADQFRLVSPYNYALNNPINMIDPDGKAPEPSSNRHPFYISNGSHGKIDVRRLTTGERYITNISKNIAFSRLGWFGVGLSVVDTWANMEDYSVAEASFNIINPPMFKGASDFLNWQTVYYYSNTLEPWNFRMALKNPLSLYNVNRYAAQPFLKGIGYIGVVMAAFDTDPKREEVLGDFTFKLLLAASGDRAYINIANEGLLHTKGLFADVESAEVVLSNLYQALDQYLRGFDLTDPDEINSIWNNVVAPNAQGIISEASNTNKQKGVCKECESNQGGG